MENCDTETATTAVFEITVVQSNHQRSQIVCFGRRNRLIIGCSERLSSPLSNTLQNDIELRLDWGASGMHAWLVYEDGGIYVADLMSTTGTFVNHRRLQRGEKVLLSDGDKIRINQSILIFKYVATAREERLQAA